jgi:hypothetical protein
MKTALSQVDCKTCSSDINSAVHGPLELSENLELHEVSSEQGLSYGNILDNNVNGLNVDEFLEGEMNNSAQLY